jgi:hypothetical protein
VYLSLPERVSLTPVCIFAVVLCTIQVYQGTAPLFSLGCFFFIIISAVAFNVAGGLTRPSGGYIFFFSILAVILGLFWKAVLGEPADSNLAVPLLTIEIYVCSICGMLAAVFISKHLTSKPALLANFVTDDNMQTATVGCLVAGLILLVIFALIPNKGEGTVLSGLSQLNRFLLMAIVLGVIHAIRCSGGTRSVSFPVLLAGVTVFVSGIFGFSKEGMITPFLCWVLAAATQRYKLSVGQIAGGILVTLVVFQYLVPYSQYGRNFRATSYTENISVSISMLGDLEGVRKNYLETEKNSHDEEDELFRGYFTNHQGFFDRLQMIAPDDSLNEFTERGVVPGIGPIYIFFENLVPHFIWKNKPSWSGGNLYARQMGYIADYDDSTGVSFSPAAEAFHLMRWIGVLIVAPILWIMLFTLFDSLCGDVRKSPWGLLVILTFAHTAPEGGLMLLVYCMGYTTAGILFAAYTATYLMPILGEIIIGPHRRTVRFRDPLRINPRENIADQNSTP